MYQQPNGAFPQQSNGNAVPRPSSSLSQQPLLPQQQTPNYAQPPSQMSVSPMYGMQGAPQQQWAGQAGGMANSTFPPSSGAPAGSAFPPHHGAQQSTADAMRLRLQQQQQQYAQQQYAQQQQQQQNPGTPSSQPQYPQQPSFASSTPQPSQLTPQQMTDTQLHTAVQSINLKEAMSVERFNSLPPQQQAVLREYMTRSHAAKTEAARVRAAAQERAAAQAQLGLGLPSSPATHASTPARQPGGLPANGVPIGDARALAQAAARSAPTPAPSQAGFVKMVAEYVAKRGQTFPGVPSVDGRHLDLSRLFGLVTKMGGSEVVTTNRLWPYVASGLGYLPSQQDQQHPNERLQAISQGYQSTLSSFESAWMQAQQQRSAQAAAQASQSSSAPSSRPDTAGTPGASLSAASPAPSASVPPQNAFATASTPQPFAPTASLPPSNNAVDLTGSPSPFASNGQRPSTATNQREGTAPPRTAGGEGSMPPPSFGAGVDMKGKGRATDDGFLTVKTEPGLSTNLDASPKPPFSQLDAAAAPAPRRPSLPSASSSKPAEPAGPPRRKRRKIEYTPMVKPLETYGGYDLYQTEQLHAKIEKHRRQRNVHDLGTVDIHALTMSLRSGLPTEVSYSLNALALIANSMEIDPRDGGIPFPLARCPDLVEELLDLLEETAFGSEEDEDESEPQDVEQAPFNPPRGYRDLFRLITDDAPKLAPPSERERFQATRSVETVLSVLNLLRNLTLSSENASTLGQEPRVLDVLARVSILPLRQERRTTAAFPLHVSPEDSMAIKKDVLETINSFGLDVRLAEASPEAAQSVVDLILFFLRDAHHRDQLYFDLSSTPSVLASRHPQPLTLSIPPYLEMGLSVFARVALLDTNRSTLARLLPPETIYPLFESLVFLLPVVEKDFHICTFEAGLVHIYHIVLGLYNLAYIAPVAVKLRLRSEPRFVRSLVRVVRRLAGSAVKATDDLFVPLAQRCIGTLQLLRNLGGVSSAASSSSASTSPSNDAPWWGLSMSGSSPSDDADDPSRGSSVLVRAPLPPSASSSSPTSSDVGPPVLAGDARLLWELLSQGSMAMVFAQLVDLADATKGRGKKSG